MVSTTSDVSKNDTHSSMSNSAPYAILRLQNVCLKHEDIRPIMEFGLRDYQYTAVSNATRNRTSIFTKHNEIS